MLAVDTFRTSPEVLLLFCTLFFFFGRGVGRRSAWRSVWPHLSRLADLAPVLECSVAFLELIGGVYVGLAGAAEKRVERAASCQTDRRSEQVLLRQGSAE